MSNTVTYLRLKPRNSVSDPHITVKADEVSAYQVFESSYVNFDKPNEKSPEHTKVILKSGVTVVSGESVSSFEARLRYALGHMHVTE